jgi:hypothetical protein
VFVPASSVLDVDLGLGIEDGSMSTGERHVGVGVDRDVEGM